MSTHLRHASNTSEAVGEYQHAGEAEGGDDKDERRTETLLGFGSERHRTTSTHDPRSGRNDKVVWTHADGR